ncbi:branched-chain amino acid ABC transporter permease [Variovorax sp. WS11]|uniref:branched-chain amino acid ABC transporter permease n=1 Tax=Variovorax sp. WS11 TaxID=1105204 RepID=UPI00194E0710|nr:branched-chain amino acid ABC transporter permease [Variovorax sp. WS11]
MSAAKWRRAMNGRGASAAAPPLHPVPATAARVAPSQPARLAPRWFDSLRAHLGPHHIVVLAALLVLPFVASPFLTFQVAAQSLVLGLIALSLSFLAGYGGMVSLAQMTVAGIAGYALAVLGTSSSADISLGWPWWAAVPFALLIATLAATLIGWLSVRTEGIYTIMITLAIGVAFYYLVLQNYSLFNGFQGLRELKAPTVLGIAWRDPVPFYFLALACSLGGYLGVHWIVRTPFGIALQGIRDNPRRMRALGFHVVAHRVAAYALAGAIAAVGGILLAWYNALMSPGSVGTSWLINILVIAVLGGLRRPIGAFLGALVFVLLQTFAIDLIDRERFNLVIGGVFLAIVLFSPDGLLGLWAMLRARLGPKPGLISNQRRQP